MAPQRGSAKHCVSIGGADRARSTTHARTVGSPVPTLPLAVPGMRTMRARSRGAFGGAGCCLPLRHCECARARIPRTEPCMLALRAAHSKSVGTGPTYARCGVGAGGVRGGVGGMYGAAMSLRSGECLVG